jgi:hypothetical protein
MSNLLGWFCRSLKLSALFLSVAAPLGCVTTGDGKPALLEHCEPKVLTVSVTGLVKTPGKQAIPLGGLTLREALAIAGGDVPNERFDTPAATVLVTIDRREGVQHFSLPLVTNDLAGRVFLRPDDKVSVQSFTASDLGFSLFGLPADAARILVNVAADDPDRAKKLKDAKDKKLENDLAGWKRVLARDDAGTKNLAFNVSLRDIDQVNQTVAVKVDKDGGNIILTTPKKDSKGNVIFDQVTPDATLEDVSEMPKLASPSQTVLLLRRVANGRFHEYVLLRHAVSQSNADVKNAQFVLGAVHLLPGDALYVDVLPRVPVVLSSLIAPQLFDFANQQQSCIEKLKEKHAQVARLIEPLVDTCQEVRQIVLPPLEGLYNELPIPR